MQPPFHNAPFGYIRYALVPGTGDNPPDLRILEINETFSRLTGLDGSRLIGKGAREAFNGMYAIDEWIDRLQMIALGDDGKSFEEIYGQISLRFRIQAYSPNRGEVCCIFSRADNLEKKYDVLHKIIEHVPGVMYQYQHFPDGRSCFPFASEHIRNILGVSPDEVRDDASNAFAHVHPKDLEKVRARIARSSRTLEIWEDDFRIIHSDRGIRWLRGMAMPEKQPDGSVLWHGYIRDITERKTLEKLLEDTRLRYEMVIRSTNDGIWDWDLRSNELFLSPRWKEILGYRDIELSNSRETFLNLLADTDRERIFNDLQKFVKEKKKTMASEYRMKHRDGSLRWVQSKGVLLFDVHGKPYRMIGSHSDITERKKNEERIRTSERNFRTFFETINDMIFITDMQGDIIYTNDRVTEKLGYPHDELSGMNIVDTLKQADRDKIDPILEDMLAGRLQSSLLPLVARNGHSIPAESRIWEGTWNEKKSYFAIVKDLSREEEALRKFDNIFNLNPAPMTVSTLPEGVFIQVNDSFLETLGYHRKEVIGKTITELDIFPFPEEKQRIRETLLQTGTVRQIEATARTKSGEFKRGLCSGLIMESRGKTLVLMVIVDITDLKDAQKAAIAANLAKSEFLANMSHEIRTPLNGVIGFTNLLLETKLNETQKLYAEYANTSGESLLAIVNDILDFSKIEAGKLELDPAMTDLCGLIEQTIDIISYPANSKGLEILINIDPAMPRQAEVDPGRLRQILVNLLNNAVKFTEKGEIELKISFSGMTGDRGRFHFSVRDTGIGIRKEDKAKLFRAFSQADSSTTRKFGGTGLGLIISDMLAVKMGGKIGLESVYGEGTTFSFSIETRIITGPENGRETPLPVKRILAVDDNEHSLLILEKNCRHWGVGFTGCIDVFAALKALESPEPYDLVIMDCHMPGMDGMETVRMINKKFASRRERPPVLLLHTFINEREIRTQCNELGIDLRITKPVKMSVLRRTIAEIGKKQYRQEPHLTGTGPDVRKIDHTKATILIAEDVPLNALLARTMVLDLLPGAEILEAGDGEEAVHLAAEYRPDLILMDVQMPDMDGLEATRRIRTREQETGEKNPIPVIALTAGSRQSEKERCIASGMDAYLSKPILKNELAAILNRHLPTPTPPPPGSTASDYGDHFDREGLLSRIEHDPDIYRQTLTMSQDLGNHIRQIHDTRRAGDPNMLGKFVHKLKGACLTMGFVRLANLAAGIQLRLDNGERADEPDFAALDEEWREVCQCVDRELSSGD